MITDYEKLKIPDQGGTNDLILEVNYKDDPEVNECKILKLTYPDGSHAYLKKEHFMAFVFAIGRAEEQRDLIPKKIQVIRKYQTILGITATKDIRKGEKINVQVDIPLPPIEKEIIEESKKQLTRGHFTGNGIITPKT